MSWRQRLVRITTRHAELEALLASGGNQSADIVKLSKEHAELNDVVAAIHRLNKAEADVKELESLLADSQSDKEMRDLAHDEIHDLKKLIPVLERELQIQLLPKDEADNKNAILEVRAGTGGEEAALFAGDLFAMYQKYAAYKGWRWETISVSEAEQGGLKEASANITGMNVYAHLKFESGVHRVQRVPKTESQGRVHTSAATVAILPDAEEADVQINDSDLRFDTYRSSGAGGQHVNTTDSAVRVTHIPTGIAVAVQEERSQHKNKAKALKVLRSRIYEIQREQLASTRAADRKSQVGSGDRSERIRTYNFPQGRVSDHRINLTTYNIDDVMAGDGLNQFIEALMTTDQTEKLLSLGEN